MGGGGGTKSVDDFPVWHKIVGISLALSSAALIGASFVIKKRGLLDSNIATGKRPGEGHGYLKNALWWLGLILMLVGELCNVAAYAFSPAILVTPLGAVSVVISAVLSDFFLKEKLNFSAKIGCAQCLLGAVLLVVNSPASNTTTTIQSFWNFALDPIFLAYFFANCAGLAYLIFYAAPRWGERWPLIYISICSIMGSFVVVSMQGFGSAVVYTFSAGAANQFKEWSMYPLLLFVILTGVAQINYLNKALNIFSTAIVTPIYYVFFTTATLACSAVLLRDFKFDSAINGVSAMVGFLVIVGGVALLFAYSLQVAKTSTTSPEKTPAGTDAAAHLQDTSPTSSATSAAQAAQALKLHKRSSSLLRYGTSASTAPVTLSLRSPLASPTHPSVEAQLLSRSAATTPQASGRFFDEDEYASPAPANTGPSTLVELHSYDTAGAAVASQGFYGSSPPQPAYPPSLLAAPSSTPSPPRSGSPPIERRLTIDTPPGGFASMMRAPSPPEEVSVGPPLISAEAASAYGHGRMVLVDLDDDDAAGAARRAGRGLSSRKRPERKDSSGSEAFLIDEAAPPARTD
ncbi:hypothetical protein HDU96_007176 [Phlyctochytrium bullatum]|nr:hypothetical protein HDU96_007176 [Phlyctochytrium bullatum]